MKRKEKKEWKEMCTVKYEEVGNIEKNGFCSFVFISKIKLKGKKTHGY